MNNLEDITMPYSMPSFPLWTNTNNFTALELIKKKAFEEICFFSENNLFPLNEYVQYDVTLTNNQTRDFLKIDNYESIKRELYINREFKKEFSKYAHYISGDISTILETVFFLNKKISSIDYKKIGIELSPLNSIKYKLVVKENRYIVINKPFGQIEDLAIDEILFSYFVNEKCVLSIKKNIYDLIEGLNKFLED